MKPNEYRARNADGLFLHFSGGMTTPTELYSWHGTHEQFNNLCCVQPFAKDFYLYNPRLEEDQTHYYINDFHLR